MSLLPKAFCGRLSAAVDMADPSTLEAECMRMTPRRVGFGVRIESKWQHILRLARVRGLSLRVTVRETR